MAKDAKYILSFIIGLIMIFISEHTSNEAVSIAVVSIVASFGALGMVMEDYIKKTEGRYDR